ncbi:MAG: elongation factor P [Pseudomonadota bacterium]
MRDLRSSRKKRATIFSAMVVASAAVFPLAAQVGGPLGTLTHGTYECSLPGDALAEPFDPIPSETIFIIPGSAYRDAEGARGLYLLRGREIVFTSGSKKGQRFRRIGDNTIKRLRDDGELGRLTCIRIAGSG